MNSRRGRFQNIQTYIHHQKVFRYDTNYVCGEFNGHDLALASYMARGSMWSNKVLLMKWSVCEMLCARINILFSSQSSITTPNWGQKNV